MRIPIEKLEELTNLRLEAARTEAEAKLVAAKYSHALALVLIGAGGAQALCLVCGEIDPPESHTPCRPSGTTGA